MICLAYTTVLTIKYVNEILKTAPGGQQLFGWSRTQLWTWKLRQNTVPLSCRHETYAGKIVAKKGFLVQIPTRIPEKIVVALFSGILVNSGILVLADTSGIHNRC